jgi:hypothetical protein
MKLNVSRLEVDQREAGRVTQRQGPCVDHGQLAEIPDHVFVRMPTEYEAGTVADQPRQRRDLKGRE